MNRKRFDFSLFLQNKSLPLIVLYSFIFLCFPLAFNRYNLFVTGIFFLLIAKYVSSGPPGSREIRIFQYLLIIYGFWIILASLIHYIALNALDPLTYIAVDKKNAVWGLWTLKDTALIYLLFPLFYSTAIYLFAANYENRKMFFLLPVLTIPSLLIALYQGLIDIEFLNHPHFIEINRVSGLDADANGFGLSLFLLFPICIIAVFLIHNIWKKLFFFLLAVFLLWCLILSGSLTGLAGVVIFIAILPWVWAWAYDNPRRRRRYIMLLSLFILVFLFMITGIISTEKGISPFPVLEERINNVYKDFYEGGIEKVIEKSGRTGLGLQAYRLTRLSTLSGWGPGGFSRNMRNVWMRSGFGYYLPFDNANNHYLHMSSELGLLGLSFNILLHLFPLWMIFCVRKKIQNRDERFIVAVTFATITIMLFLFITGPHTMAVSVLWVFAVLLALLFITAVKHGYTFSHIKIKILMSILALFSILFFYGTYDNALGRSGYKARQQADWWPYKYEKNCYSVERVKKGILRWCKNDAVLQIPVTKTISRQVTISLIVHHPDKHVNPVTVKYGGKSGAVHELEFKDQTEKSIDLPLTQDHLFEFQHSNKTNARYFVLSLDVSRTWVPKQWGVSDDKRELGVAVLIPDFRYRLK